MSRFFDALHGERFANERIFDRLRVERDHLARVAFGRDGDAPKGNGPQPLDGKIVEFRPR